MTKTTKEDVRLGRLADLVLELKAVGLAHRHAHAEHALVVGQHRVTALQGGGFQIEGGPYFFSAQLTAEMLAYFAEAHPE